MKKLFLLSVAFLFVGAGCTAVEQPEVTPEQAQEAPATPTGAVFYYEGDTESHPVDEQGFLGAIATYAVSSGNTDITIHEVSIAGNYAKAFVDVAETTGVFMYMSKDLITDKWSVDAGPGEIRTQDAFNALGFPPFMYGGRGEAEPGDEPLVDATDGTIFGKWEARVEGTDFTGQEGWQDISMELQEIDGQLSGTFSTTFSTVNAPAIRINEGSLTQDAAPLTVFDTGYSVTWSGEEGDSGLAEITLNEESGELLWQIISQEDGLGIMLPTEFRLQRA